VLSSHCYSKVSHQLAAHATGADLADVVNAVVQALCALHDIRSSCCCCVVQVSILKPTWQLPATASIPAVHKQKQLLHVHV
jgi:hypothetical protein